MEIVQNLKNVLLSPRFISFYWNIGLMALVGFINLVIENLSGFGMSATWVVIIGGVLTQVSKALDNLKKGKTLGFARQK